MSSWSETLAGLRKGDLAARDRVARLVIGTLQALGAYRRREAWDDVVQDVLMTLLEREPDRTGDVAAAAWVRRVAVNRYLDLLRAERGRSRRHGAWRRSVPLDESEELASAEGIEEALALDLERSLAALDARHRRVLDCKYRLGDTDAEGARRLGESLGTYKRRVREGLAELRRALLRGEPEA